MMKKTTLYIVLFAVVTTAFAEVKMPAIFTDHMVLQQKQQNKIWGWASGHEKIAVTVNGQIHKTTADKAGNWSVKLAPLAVGGPYEITVQGKNTITLKDVLSGEVWLCSGQSNMGFRMISALDADLEVLSANYPNIRFITVPLVGTQEPQKDFKGQWGVCTPELAQAFSAVGYYFGKQIHLATNVPVGLINCSWGGSDCQAWIRRDLMEGKDVYADTMSQWEKNEDVYRDGTKLKQAIVAFSEKLDKWNKEKAAGKKVGRIPRRPRDILIGQQRPANLYNGMLNPIIGFGIKGAIWYQGESNSGRGYQYREMFPLLIQSWRDVWQQGDFPFYWVQLADFTSEQPNPVSESWAELREAQTMTMRRLPNTGEAVIIDLGEADDIHPRNKIDVAKRLARWALAKDYGFDIQHQSPTYTSMETNGSRITLLFKAVGKGLKPFDTKKVIGFAIAGEDKQFKWAEATLVGPDKIEVWHDEIINPVAVRYGWANNPVVNVKSREGLPLTPFRTDQWRGVTAGVGMKEAVVGK